MRVPECPLCNKPVPVRKGELPDRAVGEHIDRECHSDPAERLRRLSRRCSLATCRKIEVFSFPYAHNYTLLLLPGSSHSHNLGPHDYDKLSIFL